MVNDERSRRDVCRMQKLLTALIAPAVAAVALAVEPGVAEAQSRIKDIVSIEGVRSNQLVGYGLVVGLNGTGDSVRNSPFRSEEHTSELQSRENLVCRRLHE